MRTKADICLHRHSSAARTTTVDMRPSISLIRSVNDSTTIGLGSRDFMSLMASSSSHSFSYTLMCRAMSCCVPRLGGSRCCSRKIWWPMRVRSSLCCGVKGVCEAGVEGMR